MSLPNERMVGKNYNTRTVNYFNGKGDRPVLKIKQLVCVKGLSD